MTLYDDSWKFRGVCRDEGLLQGLDMDRDDWFLDVRRVKTAKAREICQSCPVMQQCQTYAREEGIPEGVWGGEDDRQRAAYWAANGGRPTAFDELLMIVVPDSRVEEESEEQVA